MATLQELLANNDPEQLKKMLGVPVGDPTTPSDVSSPADIKNDFLVNKNMGQTIGQPSVLSPSADQLKANFKASNNVNASPSDPIDSSMSEMTPHDQVSPKGFQSDSPVSGPSHAEDIDELLHSINKSDLSRQATDSTRNKILQNIQDIKSTPNAANSLNGNDALAKAAPITEVAGDDKAILDNLKGSGKASLEDLYKYLQESKAGKAISSLSEGAGKAAGVVGKVAEPLVALNAAREFGKESDKDTDSMSTRDYLSHLAKQAGNIGEGVGGASGAAGTVASMLPYGASAGTALSSVAVPLMANAAFAKLLADHPLPEGAASEGSTARTGNPDGLDKNPIMPSSNAKPLSEAELAALSGPNSTPNILGKALVSAPPKTLDPTVAEDEDDTDEDTKIAGKGSKVTNKASFTQRGIAQTKDSQADALQAALNNPNFSNNTVENLRTVQDQANKDKNQADMFKAVNMINSGLLSKAYHSATPDTAVSDKFQDDQKKEADSRVTDFNALTDKEKDDPNSQASANMRKVAAITSKSLGFNIPDNLSYNQIKDILPGIERFSTAKDNRDAKSADLAQKYEMMNLYKQKMGIDKASGAQDKALLSTQQLLESARGNPAAAQAEKDMYSADKAKSLATLYGDPNKLPPQMVQMLASEVAKIASGGAPTMHELDGLNPQTLRGRFADISQKLTNSPTQANAGEFIKQYQDYANALTKDAQKVIQDKYGRVIESRKGQLGDSNYKALQDHYLNRFAVSPKDLTTSSTTGAYPKVVVNKTTGQQATVSNDSEFKEAANEGFQ
jgi:hypothetical protein